MELLSKAIPVVMFIFVLSSMLAMGRQHLEEGVRIVDLAEVTEMDSSLLALLLAWLREAKAKSRELTFANMPEALHTIARLYGVEELLPLAAALIVPMALAGEAAAATTWYVDGTLGNDANTCTAPGLGGAWHRGYRCLP